MTAATSGQAASGNRDAERGAGTVLLLGVAAVVLLAGLALAALGAAQQARGTAQAAADLGALAAATALRDGFEPCPTARDAVERNGGTLAGCVVEGAGVVDVTVARPTAGLPGWATRDATATARAGPRPEPDRGTPVS
ncbi:Rv3654c family TadE-like protein [Xylanimonas protaetiae]|uniref:Histidine kinase n=1 Tax=Xylanimonas protaetiae TaxID=2509457 RepID=A0A4P6F2P5_9MICO|nr:Rv3654c family TadE-like protein [Xylanimonas protaetiae]QAY69832.1 histidine kinase [Xylanimonas protaetiae]